MLFRDHSVYSSSQWETTLRCYVVSHWLGASLVIERKVVNHFLPSSRQWRYNNNFKDTLLDQNFTDNENLKQILFWCGFFDGLDTRLVSKTQQTVFKSNNDQIHRRNIRPRFSYFTGAKLFRDKFAFRWYSPSQNTERCKDAKFVVTGGTRSYCYDNIRCHRWRHILANRGFRLYWWVRLNPAVVTGPNPKGLVIIFRAREYSVTMGKPEFLILIGQPLLALYWVSN